MLYLDILIVLIFLLSAITCQSALANKKMLTTPYAFPSVGIITCLVIAMLSTFFLQKIESLLPLACLFDVPACRSIKNLKTYHVTKTLYLQL